MARSTTWFAEHTVVDLVERARRWLRETARNRLVPEGDGFEPTRAIDTLGTFYHPPGDNLGRILDHWKAHGGGAGHAVTSFDLLDDESMAEIGTTGVRGPAGRVRLVGVLR